MFVQISKIYIGLQGNMYIPTDQQIYVDWYFKLMQIHAKYVWCVLQVIGD